jgi:hypothetical protein
MVQLNRNQLERMLENYKLTLRDRKDTIMHNPTAHARIVGMQNATDEISTRLFDLLSESSLTERFRNRIQFLSQQIVECSTEIESALSSTSPYGEGSKRVAAAYSASRTCYQDEIRFIEQLMASMES